MSFGKRTMSSRRRFGITPGFACASLLGFMLTSAAVAADPQPGSPEFRPSPERPVGWRGDGTGKYPDANPPIHWGQRLEQLGTLKCAAAVPKDGGADDATPTVLGFFTEWLVAGPVPCTDQVKAIKEELIPGEAAFAPTEGDKLGNVIWKTVKVEDSFIDLFRHVGEMTKEQAAYVQACLFTDKPMTIWFHFVHARGVAFWFNGKLIHSDPEYPLGLAAAGPVRALDLQKGWNRFLFKVTPRVAKADDFPPTCYVRCRFWPVEGPREYTRNNIAWVAAMPGLSQAMPIILGDRVFTTAHPYNLVCVDKTSGKTLWIRSNSPYDAASAADRQAKPELFARMDALAAKREAYYRDFVAGRMPSALMVRDETGLEDELDKLMLEVDPKYKRPQEQGEPDWWTIPTPASDGSAVYVYLTRGVSARYDMAGNRRWIRYEGPKHQHHGYFGSPVIVDGKLVILDGTVTALDLVDGSVKWSVDLDKIKSWRLWFGSLSRFTLDGTDYVLCPGGNIMMRARDGALFGQQPFGNFDSTPIWHEGHTVQTFADCTWLLPVRQAADGGLTVGALKSVKWPKRPALGLNFYCGNWLEASPLIHDGLGYVVSGDGVLGVFDVKTMESVYQKELPLDLFHAENGRHYFGSSATLAGRYIYLMGSTGVTIVIKPGRKYEEVARNRIQSLSQASFHLEDNRRLFNGRTMGEYRYFLWSPRYCPEYQECTMTSTPIFDGRRMIFRGAENLYCIEEK